MAYTGAMADRAERRGTLAKGVAAGGLTVLGLALGDPTILVGLGVNLASDVIGGVLQRWPARWLSERAGAACAERSTIRPRPG